MKDPSANNDCTVNWPSLKALLTSNAFTIYRSLEVNLSGEAISLCETTPPRYTHRKVSLPPVLFTAALFTSNINIETFRVSIRLPFNDVGVLRNLISTSCCFCFPTLAVIKSISKSKRKQFVRLFYTPVALEPINDCLVNFLWWRPYWNSSPFTSFNGFPLAVQYYFYFRLNYLPY